MRQPALLCLCLVTLTACAPFPQVGAPGPDSVAPPPLLPIDALIAQAGVPAPDPGPSLAARAAALKARAAALAAAP